MSNPNTFSASDINEQYNEYLATVSKPFGITKEDRRALRQVDPMYFLPWSFAAFSGGEHVVNFPTDDATLRRDLGGHTRARALLGQNVPTARANEFDMRAGELAGKIKQLEHTVNIPTQNTARKARAAKALSTISVASADFANILMRHAAATHKDFGSRRVPRTPGIRVRSIDDRPSIEIPQGRGEADIVLPLNQSLGRIATLGPGLSGVNFALDAMGAGTKEVHFISGGVGGEFVNRLLENQLRDATSATDQNLTRHYYNDGIAAGMQSVGEKLATEDGQLDAVIMSAVHSAGPAECQAGITGAHRLLRASGLLAIKAPIESPGDFAGFDSLTSAADLNTNFTPIAGGPLPGASLLSPYIPGENQYQIPTAYAILQKR